MRVLAIHLPQFHPIPENDRWWGTGFTEWRNVAGARSLFPGHRQPRIPADLGFYDLRMPEAREAQARMAGEHGIHGFCHYHYWFNGRRLLDTPVREMLRQQSPDFPFSLVWANETWSRRWLGEDSHILQAQTYSEKDNERHAAYLAAVFLDRRYIRVRGRPLFIIYRPVDMPLLHHFVNALRRACEAAGVGNPLVLGSSSHAEGIDMRVVGLDGTLDFQPKLGRLAGAFDADPAGTRRGNAPPGLDQGQPRVYAEHAFRRDLSELRSNLPFAVYPSVFVSWDNTPRRGEAGIVVWPGGPNVFREGLDDAIAYLDARGAELEEPLLFINAWNEWGEGNYLEPDTDLGCRYLDEVRSATTVAQRATESRRPATSCRQEALDLREWPQDRDAILARIQGPATLKIVAKVLDEPGLMRSWIEHHSRIVGWENLIVADNGSNSAESAALYAEYGGRINIFRLQGNADRIHSDPEFESLYARIRQTCAFFSFIDADERLVMCTPDSWSADTSLLDHLASRDPGEIIPTTWLYNHVQSFDTFQFVPVEDYGGLREQLMWGKPLLPSILVGLEAGVHNIQQQGFAFTPCDHPLLFLLHYCNFPAQRIEANRKKLTRRGVIDSTWTLDDIVAANFIEPQDSTQHFTRFISEIEEMRQYLNGTRRPDDSHHIRLSPDGSVVCSDPLIKSTVAAYFRDWRVLAAEFFGGAAGRDPRCRIYAPPDERILERISGLKACGRKEQVQLLHDRLQKLRSWQ